MSISSGSKFREDDEKIEMLQSPFKEEIFKLNAELKQLNSEKHRFKKQLFGGIKGLLYKKKNKILRKQDFISKYRLKYFYKQLNKEKWLLEQLNSYRFTKDADKIDSAQISAIYDLLEDRLSETICFVKMILKYKNSNYHLNELYQKSNSEASFAFHHILSRSVDTLLIYIDNPEIKELGQKMCAEYIQKEKESKRSNADINHLKEDINRSEDPSSDLETLRAYKNVLDRVRVRENPVNNAHKK